MVDYSNSIYQEDLRKTFPYLKSLLAEKPDAKILITGATGLVGSFLADAIDAYRKTEKSSRIKLFLLSRGREKVLARFPWIDQKVVYIIEQDIRNGFPAEDEFDYIIHLASNADPASYANYPVETIETNVIGASSLVQYLKKHPSTKAVFASSMEVYGETDSIPLREEDYGLLNYNLIRAGYPESKRTAELLIRSAAEEFGIQCVIARLGYLYGSTMQESDNKIVSELIRKASLKKPITLNTPGSQRRTYCYVGDAATALLLLLQKGKSGEAVNVADRNSEITIHGLAELVCQMYGLGLTVCDQSVVRTNTNVVLDTKRIEELGWNAAVSLQEGIKRSVDTWCP